MLITVTNAGLAALVNAQNTGTLPVLVAQISITSTAFAPNAGLTALPGEIKRLSTFSGQAVADDTIHVTIRDETADTYTMRGFGLYLNDGTLFAVYGQSDPLLEKSPQAMMLLSADIRFSQIEAASLTFGDSNWINPPATTETAGVVELATNAEANAGADTQRAVTPAGLNWTFQQRSPALLDWNNFTNVPAAFPPSAHGHAWGDISGVPAAFPPSVHGHAWSDISGTPTEFPPSAHSHDNSTLTSISYSKITNRPELLSGQYTPTVYNAGSFDSISASSAFYVRVANAVFVSGRLTVNFPSTTGTTRAVSLSVPIASNITSDDHVYGGLVGYDGASHISVIQGHVRGLTTSPNGASLICSGVTDVTQEIRYWFMYIVR